MNSAPKYAIHPLSMIRTSQIITVALIAGVVIFALAAQLLLPDGPAPQPFIAWIALAFAVPLIALRYVIPGMLVKASLKDARQNIGHFTPNQLRPVFQTRLILGLAMLEGAAFFNLVAYLLERQWFSMAAAGVLVLLMVMMFPTLNQYENWVHEFELLLNNAS